MQINRRNGAAALGAAALVIAVLAVGGYVWSAHVANRVVAEQLDQFKAALGPGAELSYASARGNALSHTATVDNLVVKQNGQTISMDRLVVNPGTDRLKRMDVDGLHVAAPQYLLSADHLDAENVVLPHTVQGQGLDPVSLEFGQANLRNTHLKATQPVALDLAYDGISIRDYSLKHTGQVDATGMTLTSPGSAAFDTVHADHILSSGINLPEIVAVMRTGSIMTLQPGASSGEMDGLDIRKSGATIVHFGKLHTDTQIPNPGVTHYRVDGTGFEIPANAVPAAMKQIGYDTVQADFSFAGSYDRNTGRLALSPYKIDARNMGTLELSANLDHVPPFSVATPPAAYATMQLQLLDLFYKDSSLVNRLLDAGAKQRGISRDDLKTQLVNTITSQAQTVQAQAQTPSPALTAIAEALEHFIQSPNTLSISAHPRQPVALTALLVPQSNPSALLDMLNLSVVSR